MSSPCGRAPQAERPPTAARYRVGPKRNCGTAGLFQAQDAWGTPLADVSLLRLQRGWLRQPGSREALESELARVASLCDPHLVLARELVRIDQHEYLVLRGPRAVTFDKFLAKARRAGVRLPPSVVSRIFLDVAAGLSALHAQLARHPNGLLNHAALSSTTIWVDGDGTAAVLDCCLARALPAQATHATNGLFGQLGCRPPEALAQAQQDASSDTYSLTVLLCEALSGRHLFLRDSLGETLSAICEGRRLAEAWQADFGLERGFVSKGLSVNRSDRHRSASAFAEALRRQLPPASRTETAEWVQHVVGVRRSSWPLAESGRLSCTVGDESSDEEITHRDIDEPTKVMPHDCAPSVEGGAPPEVISALAHSVPPKLLRRLAEQDALERLRQKQASGASVPRDGVAWCSVNPEPSRRRGSSGALRFRHVVLGVAIGVSACAVWENYGTTLWGDGGSLGDSAAPASTVESGPVSVAGESARAFGVAPRVNGEASTLPKGRAQPKLQPSAKAKPSARAGGARSQSAGNGESAFTEPSGDPPRASSARLGSDANEAVLPPSLSAADSDASAPIRVPRRLHPRLNPLMTTQQVYPKRR